MANQTKKSGITYNAPTLRSWRDEGHFFIPGIVYRGEKANYLFFEQMTPAMTQEKLAELYEQEKQKGNPHPTDAPLFWAIATRGCELRDENPEEAGKLRKFLRNGFRKCSNTLTRIAYGPSGDRVIHNTGTSDEYSTENRVFGPDQWMRDMQDKGVLDSLLGTQDVSQINRVSQWINGTDVYLWRLNSKPEKTDERDARFEAYDDRLLLYCDWVPLNEDPAFRVLRAD